MGIILFPLLLAGWPVDVVVFNYYFLFLLNQFVFAVNLHCLQSVRFCQVVPLVFTVVQLILSSTL